MTLQNTIEKLNKFWSNYGCIIAQPYGLEVGAGTANPNTFFRVLGPEPYNVAYVEPSRRPADGRYGKSPNRFQHYYQYQVILKPAPKNNQELYIKCLKEIGLDILKHDIRFVEDNWESIPLGAWGLGWEIWSDGMEITQYTYFQQVAGIYLDVPALEITFGLERMCMYIQDVSDYHYLKWNDTLNYSDILEHHEFWQSKHNFETSDIDSLKQLYNIYENQVSSQLNKNNYWSAYDYLLKLSHVFNLLDARGVISVSDRAAKFVQMQKFAKQIGIMYLEERKNLNYPLLKRIKPLHYDVDILKLKNTKLKKENKYILELGFEEIPADYLIELSNIFNDQWLVKYLNDIGLIFSNANIFITPRRIVIIIEKPAYEINVLKIIKEIPEDIALKNNKEILKKQLELFNLNEEKNIKIVEKNNKKFIQIFQYQKLKLKDIIENIINFIIENAPKDKFMRWNNNNYNFIRPLRWIFSYLDNKHIPIKVFDINSDNFTYTPRYTEQKKIQINSVSDYQTFLNTYKIQIDHKKRYEIIKNSLNTKKYITSDNIDQYISLNTFLVESPVVQYVKLEKKYLELPKKVIIEILEKNQKYLIRWNKKGYKDIEYGIVINRIKPTKDIIYGNKKVANARLDDGLFYFNLDKQIDLSQKRLDLKNINFHPQLGNYFDKVNRINTLIEFLYNKILNKEIPIHLQTALKLIKNDKATNLGKEFPNLEGYIGRDYAKIQKYGDIVADILYDHYLPISNDSALPNTEESIYLSMIDKIDNITSLSIVEGFPEGNDMYGIRKNIYNLLRLLIEKKIDIDIKDIVYRSYEILNIENVDKNVSSFFNFLNTRLYLLYKTNTNIDNIILNITNGNSGNIFYKVEFIHDIKKTIYKNINIQNKIFDTIKRINNILKSQNITNIKIDENICNDDEKQLIEFIHEYNNKKISAQALIYLSDILDKFFKTNLVLSDNEVIKENRLSILLSINNIIQSIYKH